MAPMDPKRALEVMGLQPGADLPEVKRAFKALVRQWHPDQFGHAPGFQQLAGDRLKEINAAYAVLKARPAALPRAPAGAGGGSFWQAARALFLTFVRHVITLKPNRGRPDGRDPRPAEFRTVFRAAQKRYARGTARAAGPPGRPPRARKAAGARQRPRGRRAMVGPRRTGGRVEGVTPVEGIRPIRKVGRIQ